MKIEKINENQIKIELMPDDLRERHIVIDELAYGSAKAKALFKELMDLAFTELAFDTEDFPVMVEAVPMGEERLTLTITKVDNPDELDTRFSRFSNEDEYLGEYFEDMEEMLDLDLGDELVPIADAAADEILNAFKRIKDVMEKPDAKNRRKKIPHEAMDITKMFEFEGMDSLLRAASVTKDIYAASNSLYKHPINGNLYLIVHKGTHTPEEYNRVCNTLSEYGTQHRYGAGTDSYMKEHYKLIIASDALDKLGNL